MIERVKKEHEGGGGGGSKRWKGGELSGGVDGKKEREETIEQREK